MKSALVVLVSLFCLVASAIKSNGVNNRPIVGILTQPVDPQFDQYGNSYIAASYVKYIESAGARVVPVLHNSTFDELEEMFNSINGLFFPGGGASLNDTQLFYSAQYLYKLALEANDNGDYFPLFGHCMGFELLSILTSNDVNILDSVSAENISMYLNFTANVFDSYWLGEAPTNVMHILATENVCINNHVEGIYTSTYMDNELLNQFYTVLSTNLDIYGQEFVSTWEGINYPVFAMQWHAEKNQFEWNPQEDIDHSQDAIVAMQYFANFLADQARLSSHKFPSYEDEYNALIYNYKPIYSEKEDPSFEQIYIF